MSRTDPVLEAAAAFFPGSHFSAARPSITGLIHTTYIIEADSRSDPAFILQQINTGIFDPRTLVANLDTLRDHLDRAGPEFRIPEPIRTEGGETLYRDSSGKTWRAFRYEGSTIPAAAAAPSVRSVLLGESFGRFQTVFLHLPGESLIPAIADFHEVPVVFQRFQEVLRDALASRRQEAGREIDLVLSWSRLGDRFQRLAASCPTRIVHGDAKAENLLLDADTQALRCILDLDTTMPGPVFIDFGDMLRTGAYPGDEDESEPGAVAVDPELFRRISRAYLESTAGWLTAAEREALLEGSMTLIWEQAVRFLEDYLLENPYYHVTYDLQNLIRCRVQLQLLESISSQESIFDEILRREQRS